MCEMQDGNISITWKRPDSNGALITKFKVYQRRGDKKEWTEIKTIENNFTQEYAVTNLKMGEWYEFVITATNEHGESLKKGSCPRVKVPGGRKSITWVVFYWDQPFWVGWVFSCFIGKTRCWLQPSPNLVEMVETIVIFC